MAETDEFVSNNSEGFLMDSITISTAYLKMKNLCINISNEIQADIKIHNQHVLPRYRQFYPKLHGYGYGIVPDTGTGTGIHYFFKNICGTQWILDIGYDMGTGTWVKMEYQCNLDFIHKTIAKKRKKVQ
jgi:hypothetical protein